MKNNFKEGSRTAADFFFEESGQSDVPWYWFVTCVHRTTRIAIFMELGKGPMLHLIVNFCWPLNFLCGWGGRDCKHYGIYRVSRLILLSQVFRFCYILCVCSSFLPLSLASRTTSKRWPAAIASGRPRASWCTGSLPGTGKCCSSTPTCLAFHVMGPLGSIIQRPGWVLTRSWCALLLSVVR